MIADGAVAIARRPHRGRRSRAEIAAAVPGATVVGGPGTSCCRAWSTPTSTSPATGSCGRRSPTTSRRTRRSSRGPCRSTPPTRPTTTSCRPRWRSSTRSTNGITFTVEAGTVAHPDRVLAAFDRGRRRRHARLVGLGRRRRAVVGLGRRGARPPAPHAGPHRRPPPRRRVGDPRRPRPDVRRAGRRPPASSPRRDGTGLTFHLSPTPADAAAYLARTGRRPARAPRRASACSGPHVLLAHAVHLDDEEVAVIVERDVAIAYCPWAYLRLGQGVARAGRHVEIVAAGGRVALGLRQRERRRRRRRAAGRRPGRRPGPGHGGRADRLRRPRRAGAGDDRRGPGRRDGPRARLAGGRQAGRRRRRRRHRSGVGAPLARSGAAARVGRATAGRSATSWRRVGSSCATAAARRSTSTPSPASPSSASGRPARPRPASIRGPAGR